MLSSARVVVYALQALFGFIAMSCFASVARFQAKWNVGPSPLSGFAVIVSVTTWILSLFMLVVAEVYERKQILVGLALALEGVGVRIALTGGAALLNFLAAIIATISVWSQPGCKDPTNDPHSGDRDVGFQLGLRGWCNTKGAGAVFFWLAFILWASSLWSAVRSWRKVATVDQESVYNLPHP